MQAINKKEKLVNSTKFVSAIHRKEKLKIQYYNRQLINTDVIIRSYDFQVFNAGTIWTSKSDDSGLLGFITRNTSSKNRKNNSYVLLIALRFSKNFVQAVYCEKRKILFGVFRHPNFSINPFPLIKHSFSELKY